MPNIQQNIEAQVKANLAGLAWGKAYPKEVDLEALSEHLINNHIRLRRLAFAQRMNAAAAVFGESQVGKSYMVDCLLTSQTSPLNVYNAEGEATGFLESINPTGGGKEATSLISRFTTKPVWPAAHPDYPVRCIMLRPIDVVSVICDTYFNDVDGLELPAEGEIEAELARLNARYGAAAPQQEVITETEVYELREYFGAKLMEKGEAFRNDLRKTHYFERLAPLAQKVGAAEWDDVFAFLWGREKTLTDVFRRLTALLQRLHFAETVYIRLDAVQRRWGTILHVDRLYELFNVTETRNDKGETIAIERAQQPQMEVLTDAGQPIPAVAKSEFCALAMEVDFTIDNPKATASTLIEEKPFLRDIDILDFPGARSRLKTPLGAITPELACQMILRGKVAYLFNRYAKQYLISNLLFCHHDLQSNVNTLSSLLGRWVSDTVGRTPDERQAFIEKSRISPLFIIGTKFNIDMAQTPDDSRGTPEERLQKKATRWTKRFGNLQSVIGANAKNDWFYNWTTKQTNFRNIYLLRSYEYSCQGGLYTGYMEQTTAEDGQKVWRIRYDQDGRMCGEEQVSPEYVPFFKDLYATFQADAFVQNHLPTDVRDQQLRAWSEVTGVGSDGSRWIIEHLTQAAETMAESRKMQFDRILHETFADLCATLGAKHHDDNADAALREALDDAGAICFELDALFLTDKHLFSEFLSTMLISEDALNDRILQTIMGNAVVDETDLRHVFAIRDKAHIDDNLSREENLHRLCEAYHCATAADMERMLAAHQLTLDDLLNPPQMKNLAQIIADDVQQYWTEEHLAPERFRAFAERGMKAEYIERLLRRLVTLYTAKLNLAQQMALRIHRYTADQTHMPEMAEMMADICAEMINRYVNTVGTHYFNEKLWTSVKTTVEKNHFDVPAEAMADDDDAPYDPDDIYQRLPDIFDVFDNTDRYLNATPIDSQRLAYFSTYHAYRTWTERMRLAFLATCDIPVYNEQANNALRTILVDKIIHDPELRTMLKEEDYAQYHITTLRDKEA